MASYVHSVCTLGGPPDAIDAFEGLAIGEGPPDYTLRAPWSALGWLGRWPITAIMRMRHGPWRGLDPDRILPVPEGLDEAAARTWRVEHWGVAWGPQMSGYEREGPTAARLTYDTPYASPDGLWAALAPRLPPTLIVEGEYVEPGNEFAGTFRIRRSTFEAREVPFTPELYTRLTGRVLEE